jgi:hypothetical protein
LTAGLLRLQLFCDKSRMFLGEQAVFPKCEGEPESRVDSSAHLMMKAHQQNPWKPFIFRSLDDFYTITVPQDQQASLLPPVELYWRRSGQKRAQEIGSEGLLSANEAC